MAHVTRRLDQAEPRAQTAADVLRTERSRELVGRFYAVLQRHDQRVVLKQGLELRGKLSDLPGFDADQHVVHGAERAWIVAGLRGPNQHVAEHAVDAEAVFADSAKMRAACDEHHVVARRREARTKVRAHAAHAHYRYAHRRPPCEIVDAPTS